MCCDLYVACRSESVARMGVAGEKNLADNMGLDYTFWNRCSHQVNSYARIRKSREKLRRPQLHRYCFICSLTRIRPSPQLFRFPKHFGHDLVVSFSCWGKIFREAAHKEILSACTCCNPCTDSAVYVRIIIVVNCHPKAYSRRLDTAVSARIRLQYQRQACKMQSLRFLNLCRYSCYSGFIIQRSFS